ncbi:MAG: rhomboid family intramembrane serine protease [Deltaproteobacteria bacterium]|nr:rhomboid family intramembrane serine protease [Deltaproteobacteria bacterium]
MQQAKKAILCPRCKRIISGLASQCPFCGMRNPGSKRKSSRIGRGFGQMDQLIRLIIFVNIGMFLLSLILNMRSMGLSWNPLLALSPDDKSLVLLGATGTIPIDRYHRWWSLISANYLHGGLLHILFNMIALRNLAPFVVNEYGANRMLIIYTLGGTFGFWVSYMAGVPLTIGASAAICALIGAALYYGKSRGGAYGQAVYRQVMGWVMGLFLFGIMIPGINNWGHGGGILGGIVLGYLLGYRERSADRFVHKFLAMGLGALTAIVLAGAALSGVYYRVMG